ncbi:PREDICTED: dynactin subunit 6, partial [Pygoscelis adeliae]|uniref:dynactin subunit 6 n=1 Tax=Pygoscelis adeliae TaxID=9238 RepID=UPI0004F4EF6C
YPENITPESEEAEPKPMVIGTNNVFEVGCCILAAHFLEHGAVDSQAMKVGDNNVIESKAFVGRNVILTSGCIIGACCNINTYEAIPENTLTHGGAKLPMFPYYVTCHGCQKESDRIVFLTAIHIAVPVIRYAPSRLFTTPSCPSSPLSSQALCPQP